LNKPDKQDAPDEAPVPSRSLFYLCFVILRIPDGAVGAWFCVWHRAEIVAHRFTLEKRRTKAAGRTTCATNPNKVISTK
jgi:hypothetical protein